MRKRKVIKYIANLLTPLENTTNLSSWEFKNKLLRLAKLNIGQNNAIGPGFECITGIDDQ